MNIPLTIDDGAEELLALIETELQQAENALQDANLMLDQSQAEIIKLTQRNSAVTGHLQQVQSKLESFSREDIRTAYNAAIDAQQRLLFMKGQYEKLKSEQAGLKRTLSIYEKVKPILISQGSGQKDRDGRGSNIVEMVINAQESVRQRLSLQMHDGPAQALSNFIIRVDIANRYFDLDQEKAREELSNLKIEAISTFNSLKNFIGELRPMTLDDLGLFPAIKRYVENIKVQSGHAIEINIRGQERRYEPFVETLIFRAIQEIIGNSLKHNKEQPGKIGISININCDDNQIGVAINDNGKGFSIESLEKSNGLGLKLIRERVELLGGSFDIDAEIGQGCKVSFNLPIMTNPV